MSAEKKKEKSAAGTDGKEFDDILNVSERDYKLQRFVRGNFE